MKILNISLSGEFTDGLSYQDNLLTKYQVKNGHEVMLVVSCWARKNDGRLEKASSGEHLNQDGVRVRRIEMKGKDDITKRIRRFPDLAICMEEFAPDVIFHHGCQSIEERTVLAYVRKHPNVRLFIDNHADYSNSASNWASKYIQHRIMWRHYARQAEPYVEKFWGVLPARVDFLVENYGLPCEKCDLLVMGADDEEVKRAKNPEVRLQTRRDLGFSDDDFVVVTGGKIDLAKRQTLLLMDAVRRMEPDVKLLVFGPVVPQLQPEVESRLEKERIVYVPWADTSKSYDYFAAADVAVFPGRHSVYWEQVVGLGKPLVVKRWPGTDHVDVCGNVVFLEEDSAEAIVQAITQVRNDLQVFNDAAHKAAAGFLYSHIARKSIGE